MGLPLQVGKVNGPWHFKRLIDRDLTFDEIKAIERKLLKLGTSLDRKDKAEIYLEEAYSFMPPKIYWNFILDTPTSWWRLYYEFISYLQLNNWWPQDDLMGGLPPREDLIHGYVVQVAIHPAGIFVENTTESYVTPVGQITWTSQVYLDYHSAKELADLVAENSAPLEEDRMNIRNIMKGK